jgi:uncharacterized protein (DUF427 family)
MSESVWSYPRPPRVEPLGRHAVVEFDGVIIADSRRALRVLETSHPPAIYFPPDDVRRDYLRHGNGASACEWKGQASYWDIVGPHRQSRAAGWSYADPSPAYRSLQNYFAFYPGRVDACYLDDERVEAQEGDFYGGWITADIVGPVKGGAGTAGW